MYVFSFLPSSGRPPPWFSMPFPCPVSLLWHTIWMTRPSPAGEKLSPWLRQPHHTAGLLVIALTCVIAWTLEWSHVSVVHHTSALTLQACGSRHSVDTHTDLSPTLKRGVLGGAGFGGG